ncbi:MAG TPA: PQQ-binding-like beta-propeller repeat protein, partial [Verrucomicrobiota bacterium]|nr:PQQ-binding-like beta-propeller repeat protein [Verrucomicrobiota bacterium]
MWTAVFSLAAGLGLVRPAAAQVEPPRRWSFTTSGNAHELTPAATPDGGVVVLTPERLSAAGIRQAPPRVQKLSAAGELAWERDLTWPGFAWPVVLDDGAVLAAEGDLAAQTGQLHCLEADGTVRWTVVTGGTPTAAPTLHAEGRIWIPVWNPPQGAELLQIGLAGEVEWRREFGWASFGPGVSHADGQFLVLINGGLHSLNPDGSVRWAVGLPGASGTIPAVAADGTIVFTIMSPPPYGAFFLVNPDGSLRWSETVGMSLLEPVVDADGTVYLTRADGRLEVRDRRGALVRSINLPAPPASGAVLAGAGRPWVSLRSGWVAGYDADGTPAVLARGGGNRDGGGAPLLRPDDVFVAGFSGRQLIAFEGVGTPAPGAWPMLAGNTARNGRQSPPPRPAAPSGLAATPEGESVRLRWEPAEDLVTYEVWRGVSPNPAAAVKVDGWQLSMDWQDPEVLTAGQDHWYWVRAHDAAGPGAFSAPVQVRREPPPPGGRVARIKLASQLTSA